MRLTTALVATTIAYHAVAAPVADPALPIAVPNVGGLTNGLGVAVNDLGKGVGETANKVLDDLSGTLNGAAGDLVGGLGGLGGRDQLGETANDLVKGVVGTVNGLVGSLTGGVNGPLGLKKGNVKTTDKSKQTFVGSGLDISLGDLASAQASLKGEIEKHKDAVKSKDVKAQAEAALHILWFDKLAAHISGNVEFLKSKSNGNARRSQDTLSAADVDAIKALASAKATEFKSSVEHLQKIVPDLDTVADPVDLANIIVDTVGTAVSALGDGGLLNTLQSLLTPGSAVGDLLSGVLNGVGSILDGILGGLPLPDLPIPDLPIGARGLVPDLPVDLPTGDLPVPDLPIPDLPIPDLPIPDLGDLPIVGGLAGLLASILNLLKNILGGLVPIPLPDLPDLSLAGIDSKLVDKIASSPELLAAIGEKVAGISA